MYCKNCGSENIKTADYCKKCGVPIDLLRDSKDSASRTKARIRKKSAKLRWAFAATGVFAIVAFIFLLNGGYLSSYIDIFPFYPTNQRVETLQCNYAGKNLSTTITLHDNINRYYVNHDFSNKDQYIQNENYSKFIYINSKDNTIKNLVGKIKSVGIANGLNNDQTVELAACFIQNIPYDDAKANNILGGEGNTASTEQYPYQTLYDNNGICTDKTYLGGAILKEMQYGVGILLFENDKHMALGLSVPTGYTSFSTNYAVMELTHTGFAPGSIPASIEENSGLPTSNINNIKPLKNDDNPDDISFDSTKTIGQPTKVIPINNGLSYTRIVAIRNLENKIIDLIDSLDGRKSNMQKAYSNISYWDNKQTQDYTIYLQTPATTESCRPSCTFYPYYSCRQICNTQTNINKNLKYNIYSSSFNNYKNASDNYNKLVDDYNKTLETINSNINLYKGYQYN